MKLEKINDHQIRCILDRSDLTQRQLRISELAYGSEKARALFKDMMQQAEVELGFEADNIPLMIEAIPLNSDCLILVITKVEDPEELDTRFSRFSKMNLGHSEEDELDEFEEEFSDSEFDDYSNLDDYDSSLEDDLPFSSFPPQDDNSPLTQSVMNEAMDLIAPFAEAIANAKKDALKKKTSEEKSKKEVPSLLFFAFANLEQVTTYSRLVNPFYRGGSQLYKDVREGTYYLILTKKDSDENDFKRASYIASDYSTIVHTTYGSREYFEEHFQCILEEQALETLYGLA